MSPEAMTYYAKHLLGRGWCVVTSPDLRVKDSAIECVVFDRPGSHTHDAQKRAQRIAQLLNRQP